MPKKTVCLRVLPVFTLFFLFLSFASQAKELIFYPERVKNIDTEEEATSYTLVKFGLSPIPQRAIIHSAFLYLRTNEIAKEYRLHRVDESRISKVGSCVRGGYISWSVREDVVLWVLKKVLNYGWYISVLDSHGNFFPGTSDIKLVVKYSIIDLTVISGENIVVDANFSPKDIQSGFHYISAKTCLKVICNTKWELTAEITPISWPEEGANAPIPNALEARCDDSGEWLAGGGVVKTGSAAGAEGEILTVVYRFNLTSFKEIHSGSTFVFQITFTVKGL